MAQLGGDDVAGTNVSSVPEPASMASAPQPASSTGSARVGSFLRSTVAFRWGGVVLFVTLLLTAVGDRSTRSRA